MTVAGRNPAHEGCPLPEPGTLSIGPAPHWRGIPGIAPLTATMILAALVPPAAGLVLFGVYALRVLVISLASALLAESIFNLLSRRSRSWSESYALLTGVLLACTLPPDVSWHVPLTGALIAVLIGQLLSGGVGNFLWHPVAMARVLLQLLFPGQLTPDRWLVLAPGHLLWGNPGKSAILPMPAAWSSPPPGGVEAWQTTRVVDVLSHPLASPGKDQPVAAMAELVRDHLPPWLDTLTGVAGGAVGEACVLAILGAGLFLMWRGILRWPMVVAAVIAAALVAAAMPVRMVSPEGAAMSLSVPAAAVWEGLPVGLAYVCYHLTAGELVLVLALLAADPTTSPLTTRGHAWFGVLIGAGTILLRVGLGLPGAGYWALLVGNTCVPLINRLTRRRVLGT